MKRLIHGSALLTIAVVGLAGPAAAGSAARDRCPKPSSADVLCRTHGDASVASPDGVTATATTTGTSMHYGSKVHVGSHGRATALFARQATCHLGGFQHATDLWTRYGDVNPLTKALPLFYQAHGDAACAFHGHVSYGTKFFCTASGGCPLTVYADGSHESDVVPQEVADVGAVRAEARAAQAGTTTVSHTKATIDFCAGSYDIDYVDSSGAHHREVDAGDGEDEHIHAEVEETRVETTSNGTSTTSTSASTSTTSTTNSDGSTTTTTTDENGTVTTTVTAADGTMSTTVTSSSGSTSSGTATSTASAETLSLFISAESADDGACAVFD